MTEYPQHKQAKARIGAMFAQTHKVEYEKELPCITEQGERNYIADIFLTRMVPHQHAGRGPIHFEVQQTIIEIDGSKIKQGHYTKKDLAKMKLRDATFRAQGIKTARLHTPWVVGRKALSDADLKKEIEWQLAK